MGQPQALNLQDVDRPIWRVLVNSEEYGPYTLGQMRAYLEEGRIGPQTKAAAGDGQPFIAMAAHPEFKAAATSARPAPAEELSNIVVIAHVDKQTRPQLIAALNAIGAFATAGEAVFVLRTRFALADVRRVLEIAIGEGGDAVIVDASHNRIGWLGLGDEVGAHVRSVWNAPASGAADRY